MGAVGTQYRYSPFPCKTDIAYLRHVGCRAGVLPILRAYGTWVAARVSFKQTPLHKAVKSPVLETKTYYWTFLFLADRYPRSRLLDIL